MPCLDLFLQSFVYFIPQPVDMSDLLEFVSFEGIRAIPRSCTLDANSLSP